MFIRVAAESAERTGLAVFLFFFHLGTLYYPGMKVPGTRDKNKKSGTIPGNPGHVGTLLLSVFVCHPIRPATVLIQPEAKKTVLELCFVFLLRGINLDGDGILMRGPN